jgi:hypothetical protein
MYGGSATDNRALNYDQRHDIKVSSWRPAVFRDLIFGHVIHRIYQVMAMTAAPRAALNAALGSSSNTRPHASSTSPLSPGHSRYRGAVVEVRHFRVCCIGLSYLEISY